MKMLKNGAFALATLLGITAAQAADVPRQSYAIAPIPVVNWAGGYVGINGGYGFTGSRTQTLNDGFSQNVLNASPSGVVGGFTAGYNWQIDNQFVLGIEGDINWSGMKSTSNASGTAFGFIPTGAMYQQSPDWFYTLRGRGGYLVTPNSLLYATGGYGSGCGTVSGNTTIFAFPTSTFTAKNCFGGLTVGGGAELKTRHGWSVKVEYLYMGPKNTNVQFTDVFGRQVALPIDNKAHIIRAGLNFPL